MHQERAWIGYPSQTSSWEDKPLGPGIGPERAQDHDIIIWLLPRIGKEIVVVGESTSHSTRWDRRAEKLTAIPADPPARTFGSFCEP
jgi:hypothetical protein